MFTPPAGVLRRVGVFFPTGNTAHQRNNMRSFVGMEVSMAKFHIPAVLGSCALGVALHAQPVYTVIELGVPDSLPTSTPCRATGIDITGRVCGECADPGSNVRTGFVWTSTEGFSILVGTNGTSTSPLAIAPSSGAVVGYSFVPAQFLQNGTYWPSATQAPIATGTLPGGNFCVLSDVNDAGIAAGASDVGFQAFPIRWTQAGGLLQLALAPGALGGEAVSINAPGQIAGTFQYSNTVHAARWNAAGVAEDLGVPPGATYSQAWAIDTAGKVYAISDGGSAGVTQRVSSAAPGGTLQYLSSALDNTQPKSVNSQGVIVGLRQPSGQSFTTAYIWSEQLGRIDLATLLDTPWQGWSVRTASEISESGVIVGSASNGGPERAVVLLPMAPPATCDDIDFNNDGVTPDSLDQEDFLSVFGGGPCSNDPNCNDIDFNNDDVAPDFLDVELFLIVFGGGSC
jgi:uncharacterized membrane protein